MKRVGCAVFALIIALAPAFIAGAQSSAPQPATKAELLPIVVNSGKLPDGEVVLSVDLDDTGKVKQTTPVSGQDKLYAAADKVAHFFNHKQLSGVSGAIQHVYFWNKADGMKKTAPVYPPIAKTAHVAGTVELIASVAEDGHVTQVVPVSGPPMLIGSAKDALIQWIYPPIPVNGKPVPFSAVVDINYQVF